MPCSNATAYDEQFIVHIHYIFIYIEKIKPMQTNSKPYQQPRLLSCLTLLLCLTLGLGTTSCSNDDDVMEIFVGGGKT